MMAETALVQSRQQLESLLNNEKMMTMMAQVLPRHLTPERMVKMALVAASKNDLLLKCTKASLAKAVMTSAELGLDCSGTLGSAYLVPYRNGKTKQYEAVLIPGYRGLIDLARRSGQIETIEARVVHEKDTWDVDLGRAEPIQHKPYLLGDAGPVILVYAQARLKDTRIPQVEYMTVAEVNKIQNMSQAGRKGYGPWSDHWEEMARKTVIRRLVKYLPVSVELEKAFVEEDAAEGWGEVRERRRVSARTVEDQERVMDRKLGVESEFDQRRDGVLDEFSSKFDVPTDAVLGLMKVQTEDEIGEEELGQLEHILQDLKSGDRDVDEIFGAQVEGDSDGKDKQ